MEKFNSCFYGLPLAALFVITAQSAAAGESNWYIRGDGAFAFSHTHVMSDGMVYPYVIYDVPSDYTATAEEFFNGPWEYYSEPYEVVTDKKFNVRGGHYTAGIGRHITKNHRVQLDYTNLYLKKKDEDDGDSAKIGVEGAIASLHLGAELHQYVLPYVMGGAGYGVVKVKYDDPANGISVNSRKGTPIWQAGAGILFPINNYVELDAGYKCTFVNRKLSRGFAYSNSDLAVEYDGDQYNAFLSEAYTDTSFKAHPIHSFFLGLKFNIN